MVAPSSVPHATISSDTQTKPCKRLIELNRPFRRILVPTFECAKIVENDAPSTMVFRSILGFPHSQMQLIEDGVDAVAMAGDGSMVVIGQDSTIFAAYRLGASGTELWRYQEVGCSLIFCCTTACFPRLLYSWYCLTYDNEHNTARYCYCRSESYSMSSKPTRLSSPKLRAQPVRGSWRTGESRYVLGFVLCWAPLRRETGACDDHDGLEDLCHLVNTAVCITPSHFAPHHHREQALTIVREIMVDVAMLDGDRSVVVVGEAQYDPVDDDTFDMDFFAIKIDAADGTTTWRYQVSCKGSHVRSR